ncbi:hypothetical protein BN2476_690011 [Paraburkholderia piptadeniae]|uniref:Uncharacterized protein n=1 Tax=Paraburkholderia piptadeniae TaxID=1701573 RepID=A0A1N7SQ53_9BURK|nr:hypothetical protein BN2476_690011 [Paraburkholderia piptadeniae]
MRRARFACFAVGPDAFPDTGFAALACAVVDAPLGCDVAIDTSETTPATASLRVKVFFINLSMDCW